MKELIEAFPRQIEESIAIARETPLRQMENELRNVVISGLGGSGIGGTIIADISRPMASVPVVVNKEYAIPAFVDENTLFIASSYSGGTEETLMAVEEAKEAGAHIICVTSGGKLADFARNNGYDLLLIPGGNPPRACLGYSFTQLVNIMTFHKVLPALFYEELEKAVGFIRMQSAAIAERAMELAEMLKDKQPVIYADAAMEGVAVRFRQQLNENSKMLAWHHVVPEMNHNELVGWTVKNEKLAVIFLRNETDFSRNQTRMEINKKIISEYTPNVIEIYSHGDTLMERLLYHIHLGDWISYNLSQLRGVDVMDIKVIDYLKGELAKI